MVTILRGVSGAGKSTFAKSLSPQAIFSADDFFIRGGVYHFDVSQLQAAHSDCFLRYINELQVSGNSVEIVVDNTNATVWEIAPYYAVARAYKHEAIIITLMQEPVVAAQRTIHAVPLSTIQRKHFQILDEQEWFPPHWNHAVTTKG